MFKRRHKVIAMLCCSAVLLSVPISADAGEKIIVHVELKGQITEAPGPMMFPFGNQQQLTTKKLLERLAKMRGDESVESVFVTFSNVSMGLAQIQEVRRAFDELKAAGKEVYVHMDACYSSALYWLASAASHMAVVPTGDVWVTGLYGEQLYLKNCLQKLHMEADVIHIGDYKSAGEIFSRSEPSEPAEAMINWLFDDLYRQMLEQTAESRSMSVREIEKVIDNGPYSAEMAKKRGLIDEVAYRKDFVEAIKARHGDLKFDKNYGKSGKMELDFDNPFAIFQELFGRLSATGEAKAGKPAVALIYVAGTIIPGEGGDGPFSAGQHGASSPLRKALYEAAYDEDVKAVVLRVDSPGGSAVASEIIWHATQEVAQRKPFIVSMGNVAGSGGYYVSCGGHTIFAEPGTITGSIGVVGAKMVTKGFWDWVGWNWHPVQRGKNADIMATNEAWSDAHRAKIRGWMESVYDVFKSRVQEGRGDKLAKPLDDIAGGRVYTGAQALELGLVDRLGGLDDALKYAATKANLDDEYEVKVLPKPKNILDMIFEDFAAGLQAADLDTSTGAPWRHAMPMLQTVDPQKAKVLAEVSRQIKLLQEERILVVMPIALVVR